MGVTKSQTRLQWLSTHIELDYKESWVQKNWCFWTVVLEKTLESPLDCKEIQPVHPKERRSVLGIHWKDWCWSGNSSTLAPWWEELTCLKRPWCWKRLKAGGEGNDRGEDGSVAILIQWTWVWVVKIFFVWFFCVFLPPLLNIFCFC